MSSVRSHSGASSSLQSLSSSSMSPLSAASICTLTALLLLTVPLCHSAPANLQQATTDQRQLISQIDAVCSSYLSADLKLWASDILGELCVLMLVQKSKELKVQENSKRFLFHYSRPQGSVLSQGSTPRLHPLLRLISQLHTRRERELTMHAELQGPGGIQSRGYFLYRPRNGRRSLEYE
ncbi:neuromedin-U isoform X1 [Amphiprion ocellaris]|uniref:Neuromedin U C-terminal domain-containing protein n=1 Tax=Amphiprion ocellaris TaxID=80972 RepID=A0A3Q1CN79_AMPOC|nr:neuromedin-U isoform X1 [Amphiprion ocellaris]XP_035804735.2 neuromedin-U isoform X1 [Amphiprion ocellaris]